MNPELKQAIIDVLKNRVMVIELELQEITEQLDLLKKKERPPSVYSNRSAMGIASDENE